MAAYTTIVSEGGLLPADFLDKVATDDVQGQRPEDFVVKFERPYARLLQAGVRFQAALGNHDKPENRDYAPYNMGSERYYTFVPPVDPITRWDTRVRFFALDSTNIDGEQMQWFEHEASESRAEWKIAFLHHPLYTPGRYTLSSRGHRFALEPTGISEPIARRASTGWSVSACWRVSGRVSKLSWKIDLT